jgi:hypothetical protein
MTFLLMWSQWAGSSTAPLTMEIWQAAFDPWWNRSTWETRAWLAMVG